MTTATAHPDACPTQPTTPDAPPCLYCGSSSFEPLYDNIRDRLGHVPGVWSFVRCTECGSANLRPFPKAEDLPAFYPPVYTFSPELAQSPLKRLLSTLEYRFFFQPVYRAQVRIVDRHIRRHDGQPGKLLDIGCGRGLRLLEFRKRGYEVHGMDFVPESVEYLQTTHHIPSACTDIDGLTDAYEPESFDVITAFYVLEHVLDVEYTLRQCLELLKPGGWFVGAVPLIDSVQAKALGSWNVNVCEAPRHISIPTQRAMLHVAHVAGYAADTMRLVPDPVFSCAGSASMSLFPSSSTTNVYGSRGLFGAASRVAGAAGAIALTPVAAAENLVRRPVLGILLAQKERR